MPTEYESVAIILLATPSADRISEFAGPIDIIVFIGADSAACAVSLAAVSVGVSAGVAVAAGATVAIGVTVAAGVAAGVALATLLLFVPEHETPAAVMMTNKSIAKIFFFMFSHPYSFFTYVMTQITADRPPFISSNKKARAFQPGRRSAQKPNRSAGGYFKRRNTPHTL